MLVSEPGSTQPLQVTSLGRDRYLVVDGDRRQPAFAVQAGRDTWVFIDGRVYVVQPDRDGDALQASQRDDEAALAPPMPATVVSIEVVPGQRVSRGDVLVRLEAMKMELAIKAPRDGTIGSVACRPGEFVQPGKPLVELKSGAVG